MASEPSVPKIRAISQLSTFTHKIKTELYGFQAYKRKVSTLQELVGCKRMPKIELKQFGMSHRMVSLKCLQ